MNNVSPVDIDEIDRQILRLLQLDARISCADLSRKLGVAEATIRFRVNRLVENRVITKFTCLLDPAKMGFKVSGAILLKIEPTHLELACKQLMAFKETQYLFQSTGEYDVVSVVLAEDMGKLNDLVMKTKMIEGVKDARVSVITRMLKLDPSLNF